MQRLVISVTAIEMLLSQSGGKSSWAADIKTAQGTQPTEQPLAMNYDWTKHPRLKWGYNDLHADGVPDALATVWNGKTIVFVGDDGKLPWAAEDEHHNWNAYLNQAFDVGQNPPSMWNPIRKGWGNYTILVDRDGCGRFDSPGDFYYKAIDWNREGAPEAEYYHLFPGQFPRSNKFHVNLNGERDMSFLDWRTFYYGDEQRYLPGASTS